MIKILALAVIHDVKHPEKIKDAPRLVAPREYLTGNRTDVNVWCLRMIQNHAIGRQAFSAVFKGCFILDQLHALDLRRKTEVSGSD